MTTYDITTSDHRHLVALTKSAPSEALAASLRYERTVLTRLSHPNVVELAGHAQRDEMTMTTIHAGGADLAAEPPSSLEELARFTATLAATLGDIHQLGWAHRRISPDHMVRTSAGGIQLCGFRHARETSSNSSAACSNDIEHLGQFVGACLDRLVEPETPDRLRTRLSRCVDGLTTGDPSSLAATRTELERTNRATLQLPRLRGRLRGRHGSAGDAKARPRPGSDQETLSTLRPLADTRWPTAAIAAGSVALGGLLVLLLPRVMRLTSELDPVGSWPLQRIVLMSAWSVAAVGAVYGFTVGVLALMIERTNNARAARMMNRLAPSIARRLIAGMTLAGFVTTVAAVAGTGQGPDASDIVASPPSPSGAGTTRATDAQTATVDAPAINAPAIELPPATVSPPAPASTIAEDVSDWIVRPGDNFWAIARATLSADGHSPSDDEIARLWSHLIEANRERLIDRSNPDLIVVGQRFVIPDAETFTPH